MRPYALYAAAIAVIATSTFATKASEPGLSIDVKVAPAAYPLPIWILGAPPGTTTIKIRYRPSSTDRFQTVDAKRHGDAFVAIIPCTDTITLGPIKLYAEAIDENGDVIDNLGTRKEPMIVEIVEQMPKGVDPPRLPGGQLPVKCVVIDEPLSPPDPCAHDRKYTDECEADEECAKGLVCIPNECAIGICTGAKPSKLARRLFVGIDGQLDALVLGDGSASKNDGVALDTVRALASLDWFVNRRASVGLRLGYAFLRNPTTSERFLPYHAEVRLQIFPSGIDANGGSIRGFLMLASGIGAIDRAGIGFLAGGGGAWLFLSSRTALAGGLRAEFLYPTVALGMSTELGLVIGF